MPQGLAPGQVFASGETDPVGTANEDAADDPAIWRNAADPSQSLIVATDKKAGLYVYGLDGEARSFLSAGQVNNVDLVTLPNGTILVAASDRDDPHHAHIITATLDPVGAELTLLNRFPVGAGEGYGFCMYVDVESGAVNYASALKNGDIYLTVQQIADGFDSPTTSTLIHTLPSQPEGCVFDTRTGRLYVGEETGGIWMLDLATDERQLVAPIDNQYLVADVEGLALAPQGADGGYLVASSQGDNAYAVFSLPDMLPEGRFAISARQFGATEETDGIALVTGYLGEEYPEGLFVAQDGINGPEAQNFKLVSWADIILALDLE